MLETSPPFVTQLLKARPKVLNILLTHLISKLLNGKKTSSPKLKFNPMKTLTNQHKVLIATSIFCVILLLTRIYIAENISYYFLVWNAFLAWVPLLFSAKFEKYVKLNQTGKSILFFCSWLLFFPNAPYLITDLIHLKKKAMIPLWFDVLLLVSFAWNGLLFAFISLKQIHQTLLLKFSVNQSWFIVLSTLFLSGYGIYLGRFERWNSWNILSSPFSLFRAIGRTFVEYPFFVKSMSVTFAFGLFMTSIYTTVYFLQGNENKIQN